MNRSRLAPIGLGLARVTAFLVALAFALIALAWVGLALVIALEIGLLGSPLYAGLAFIVAAPAIMPAVASWFYFDRACTATLEDGLPGRWTA